MRSTSRNGPTDMEAPTFVGIDAASTSAASATLRFTKARQHPGTEVPYSSSPQEPEPQLDSPVSGSGSTA